MIRFIYARDARILETEIFKEIKQHLQALDKQGVFIVPSQSTFLMERRLIEECGVPGFMNLEVLSFEKLTERFLEGFGGSALPAVDQAGMSMMVKNALMKTPLKKIDAQDKTIHQMLSELVGSLKREKISAAQLEKLAEEADRELTKEKLLDIANIYRKTTEQMEGLWDSFDLQDFVIGQMRENPGFMIDRMIVHGFDVYSEQRFTLLEQMIAHTKHATVTFLLPGEEEWGNPIYTREIKNARRLERIAKNIGKETTYIDFNPTKDRAMVELSKNFYAYPYKKSQANVEVFFADDAWSEIYQVGARILKERNAGIRPKNIAVLMANPKQYAPYISDIFERAGIPFFMDVKRSLLENPFSTFLLTILDLMIYRQRSYDVLRLIKSGYLDLAPREIDLLTAYQKVYGIKGYQWKVPFYKGDFVEVEELRKKAVEPLLEKLEPYRAANLAKDGVHVLRETMENLEIERKLEEQAAAAAAAGMPAQKLYMEQVFEAASGLLDEAEQMLDEKQTIKELRDVLYAGLASQEVAVIPPMTDQVMIGDMKRSIAGKIDTLFIIGANDGVLPWGIKQDGVFTTPEVELFREQIAQFPGEMDQEEQKYYILRALALPKEKLFFSYQNNDNMRPSWMIRRIEQICGVNAEKGNQEIHTFEAGLRPLAAKLRESLEKGEKQEIPGEWLEAKGVQREQMDALRTAAEFTDRPQGIGDYTQAVYGGLSGSVSFIERYYQCPYRHFLDYAIRPQQRRELDEEAMDIGNYIHELLDRFAKELRKRGISWGTVGDEEMRRIVDNEAQKIREEHNRGIFQEKEFLSMERRLRREVMEAVRAIRYQLRGTNVQIAASELNFGRESEPIVITTKDGKTLTLRGKIDRIDIAPVGDEQMARIVDYKTTEKTFDFTDFYYGIGIQLVVYLRAVQEYYESQGKEVTPAGGFYFNIHLPFVEQGKSEDERYREFRMSGVIRSEKGIAQAFDSQKEGPLSSMELNIKKDGTLKNQETAYRKEEMKAVMEFAEQLIANAAEKITEGEIPVRPCEKEERRSCAQCDYRAICRFDEAYTDSQARILKPKVKADLTDGR